MKIMLVCDFPKKKVPLNKLISPSGLLSFNHFFKGSIEICEDQKDNGENHQEPN